MNSESMVLQKFLALCSVGSRRKSQKIIEEGRVKINGRPAKLGDRVNPFEDKILLDGKKI